MQIIAIFLLAGCTSDKTKEYPHILVKPGDRQAILSKIEHHAWAKEVYSDMIARVDVYAVRHQQDPDWILSRYMMNWAEGHHYTDFYSFEDKALVIDSVAGNAPFPTVRVAREFRSPVNSNGNSYRMPEIEELTPYDTSLYMLLYNPDTQTKEMVKPRGYVEAVNRRINTLALESAILYWLSGKEMYAKFASDILDQFAKGAWYQNPIHGRRTYGFIGLETLSDATYQPLMLAYDFLCPYMKSKGYDMQYYQDVFEKFAHRMVVNGYMDCNWYAAESATLVYAALSLDDKEKQDYYLSFFTHRDTVDGRWGHTSLKTTVDEWFTPDGHWMEPGGYHTFPVSNLLRAALAMEKNGHAIMAEYPSLFKSAAVMMKYVFPNLRISSFGDTGRSFPSAELIELAMVFALKDRPEELPQLQACYNTLVENGLYSRNKTDWFGLLTYLPEVKQTAEPYYWPRSGGFDFAKFYLQRNGMDKDNGLMYAVQCASYNHNHVNGMSMELYGAGEVMGIDPGNGPYYEHPLHIEYFSKWAAHNTVVAAGQSAALPVARPRGGAEIGELILHAMEPMPDAEALSPFVSFTDTRYIDQFTSTNQQRTMAIVRTSGQTGYYVDIFRSDNPIRNDYMYHNIGNSVTLQTMDEKPVTTGVANIATVDRDRPGFRFIDSVRSTGKNNSDMVAVFTLDDLNPRRSMRVFMPGASDRNYFTGLSPKSGTAGSYSQKKLPTLMIQTRSEAWTNPFVVVYEPAFEDRRSVKRVTVLASGDKAKHIALKVENRENRTQYIFQEMEPGFVLSGDNFNFAGYFGVVSLSGNNMDYMYLGKGKSFSYGDYSVTGKDENCAFHISFTDNGMQVSCNQEVEIKVKQKKYVCPPGKEQFYNY